MKKSFKIRRRIVTNTRDVDMYIRDAYGNEHLLFPSEKKEVVVVVWVEENRIGKSKYI